MHETQHENAIFLQHHRGKKLRINCGALALRKPLWYQLILATEAIELVERCLYQTNADHGSRGGYSLKRAGNGLRL